MYTCTCTRTLQIPQIFYSLQDSVKAVLLGSVVVTDWFEKGVPANSLVEEWKLGGVEGGGAAVACDGRFLYLHGSFGLAKVGNGYGNTQKVCDCSVYSGICTLYRLHCAI